MDVVSLGPLPAASVVWQPRAGVHVLTVVARATCVLRPGEATLAPSQESPAAEDRHHGDDPARSLRQPRDLVPAKPLADVILVGSAFAPERRAARSVVARLAVGDVDKSIEVVADRVVDANGAAHEGPMFIQMPLVYERAAGGFGPIAPSWPERRDRLVGAAAGWSYLDLASRPLPEGMDLGYFNAAPRDQQARALAPGAEMVLENLHPDHARLVARLPGFIPRATLEGRRGGPVAIAMRADTLWIDTDRALFTVTFRGMVPLESADEQGRVTVTMDRASAAPEPAPPPEVARPQRRFEMTADIPLAVRLAAGAVLPFAPSAQAAPDPRSRESSLEMRSPAIESPWAPIASSASRAEPAPSASVSIHRHAAIPGVLDASNAAAGASAAASRVDAPAPAPRPAPEPRIAPRPEVREALELVWFDPESVPRLRRKPAWRPILDAGEEARVDPDFDDPALARDPMLVEDRREAFEILARAEPISLVALDETLARCQRDDGKFVPTIALFAGDLEMPFDELSALRATISTVTPLIGGDEALRSTVEAAKELLALPDLMVAPAVAEGLTRRIDVAFSQGKRAVPADYVETQRERVLIEQRRYQRRSVFGEKHLRALLRFDTGEAPQVKGRATATATAVPVYLPESLAALLPLQARFRARFVAEVRLSVDPAESHPAALRVLALARAMPAIRR